MFLPLRHSTCPRYKLVCFVPCVSFFVKNVLASIRNKCCHQGDQQIGNKFAQFFEKVAKLVAQPKIAQSSTSRLILNLQNINIKPL
jgi:hypothetical protein